MLSWTLHQKGSPKGDDCAAVAVRHELYYFGWNSDEKMEVQIFNTVSLRWKKLTPRDPLEVPSGRLGHTAVLVGGIIYIWGGCGMKPSNYDYHNLLRAFDVDTHTWSTPSVSGSVPEVRWCHSACVVGKVMYIHGGCTKLTEFTNDIYKVDTSKMVWTLINTRGTPPPASLYHSATIGTKMFVFGGWRWSEVRVFDTETDLWLSTPVQKTPPLPQESHLVSAFAYNGELYIFGVGGLWKFTPETFSWKKIEPKGEGPSKMCDMCCCMVGDRIFLFGGRVGRGTNLFVLDFSPSLKTLCKLAVIQYDLDQSELPHDIRWELTAMTSPQ